MTYSIDVQLVCVRAGLCMRARMHGLNYGMVTSCFHTCSMSPHVVPVKAGQLGAAFVEFTTPDEAIFAVDALHGVTHSEITPGILKASPLAHS